METGTTFPAVSFLEDVVRLLEVRLDTDLPADEDLEDPLCGDSRLEVKTFEGVIVDTSE